MKIKSIKKFIEKCQKKQLSSADIYKFLESYTDFDYQKLLLVENDIIEYKKRFVSDNINDIQNSPKFIAMKLNNKQIPLYSNFMNILEKTDDIDKHEEVFEAEIDEFIEEFLPGYFSGINQAQKILETQIKFLTEEMMEKDRLNELKGKETPDEKKVKKSELQWLGSEIEFVELVKSLIEAKMIQAKTEKEIFEQLADILNVPKFNKDENVRWVRDRKTNTTPFLNLLEDKLNQWASK